MRVWLVGLGVGRVGEDVVVSVRGSELQKIGHDDVDMHVASQLQLGQGVRELPGRVRILLHGVDLYRLAAGEQGANLRQERAQPHGRFQYAYNTAGGGHHMLDCVEHDALGGIEDTVFPGGGRVQGLLADEGVDIEIVAVRFRTPSVEIIRDERVKLQERLYVCRNGLNDAGRHGLAYAAAYVQLVVLQILRQRLRSKVLVRVRPTERVRDGHEAHQLPDAEHTVVGRVYGVLAGELVVAGGDAGARPVPAQAAVLVAHVGSLERNASAVLVNLIRLAVLGVGEGAFPLREILDPREHVFREGASEMQGVRRVATGER